METMMLSPLSLTDSSIDHIGFAFDQISCGSCGTSLDVLSKTSHAIFCKTE